MSAAQPIRARQSPIIAAVELEEILERGGETRTASKNSPTGGERGHAEANWIPKPQGTWKRAVSETAAAEERRLRETP